jgi:hypothetical protein
MASCETDRNSCNWLGGEAVSLEVEATDFNHAGYTNISTSDLVVHGQVRQAGMFGFVRIYESGHEVVSTLKPLELIPSALDIHFATAQSQDYERSSLLTRPSSLLEDKLTNPLML